MSSRHDVGNLSESRFSGTIPSIFAIFFFSLGFMTWNVCTELRKHFPGEFCLLPHLPTIPCLILNLAIIAKPTSDAVGNQKFDAYSCRVIQRLQYSFPAVGQK
jgi:hypothetical protein